MKHRSLLLLAGVALTACVAPQEKPAPADSQPVDARPADPKPLALFTFRATVASVPPGTILHLGVRLPEEWPTGVLRLQQAYGLVGNAAFEFPSDLVLGNGPLESILCGGPATLHWKSVDEGGLRYREVMAETDGKPLELALRLAQMPGAPVEASALEQELARGTTATADGQPVQALATRLERVR